MANQIIADCFVSITVAMTMGGCASGRVDLFDSGALRLEKVPDKRGQYRDVHAYQADDGILVVGYVRRSSQSAHVHVRVVDAAGKTVAETKASVSRVPRSARRVRFARFEAFLPVPASDGSIVRIRHHVGRCEDSGSSDSVAGADPKAKLP